MLSSLLTSRLEKILSTDYQGVLASFTLERKGSFRLNFLKTDGMDVFAEFSEKGITIQEFTPISGVYTFDKIHEYVLKGTRAFYDGKIYLQGISSMLPVLALDPHEGGNVLDICAAPGSKTTQIAMIMKNNGKITALEQNQIRYDKLMYNCRLQGATIVEGMKMDARKYFTEANGEFQKILLDAPCSAEGRIHIPNEKSYGFWTLENIAKKAELQYELLSSAVKLLAAGGTLIYSTCTLAPEENEGVVSRVISENPGLKLEDIDIGLSDQSWWRNGLQDFEGKSFGDAMKKTVRILPSDDTEGFFIAKIGKV